MQAEAEVLDPRPWAVDPASLPCPALPWQVLKRRLTERKDDTEQCVLLLRKLGEEDDTLMVGQDRGGRVQAPMVGWSGWSGGGRGALKHLQVLRCWFLIGIN